MDLYTVKREDDKQFCTNILNTQEKMNNSLEKGFIKTDSERNGKPEQC